MENNLTIEDFSVLHKVFCSSGFIDNLEECHTSIMKFYNLGLIIKKEDNKYYPWLEEKKQ